LIEVAFTNQIAFAEAWGGIGVQLRSKTSAEGAKKTAAQGFFAMEGTAERRGLQRKPKTTPCRPKLRNQETVLKQKPIELLSARLEGNHPLTTLRV